MQVFIQTVLCLSLLLPNNLAQVNESLHKHSIAELQAKIEKTHEQDRAQHYAELAHALVDKANEQFTANDFDAGYATIKQVVEYAKKSTDLAVQNEKHIKNVEIELRETSRRLLEIKKSLNSDDQPPLASASESIEKMRLQIFDAMFK